MTTAVQLAQSVAPGVSLGFKNRIINGDMRIDQRNAGASGTSGGYTVDRWEYAPSQASKVTWQQNAGSVTPPTGFSNYLGFTSSSAYSLLAADFFVVRQKIEANNVFDLAWGTINAKAVTLSFWVRSSLTGTFGIGINNVTGGSNAAGYFSTYTIASANTWQYVTISVPGPTTGTWNTGTSAMIAIDFGLGVGSTYTTPTNNAWQYGTLYLGASGAQSVVGTNGATFYITGVQLEVGTAATNFEFRDYGRELIMCQRYYWSPVVPSNAWFFPIDQANNYRRMQIQLPVNMRATPTCTVAAGGGNGTLAGGNPNVDSSSVSLVRLNADLTNNGYTALSGFTASAEL